MSQIEPILQENKIVSVIFSIKHHDIWEWYKKMEASFGLQKKSIYHKI
jgi:ribonucleoside-diphosphate reductase beta chain